MSAGARGGVKFKPLKHGDRFVYVIAGGGVVGRYRMRGYGVRMDPEKATNYVYGALLCTEDSEGIVWARGWYTKAAAALRVADALASDAWLPPSWTSSIYAFLLKP